MINNNFLYGLADLAIGTTTTIPGYLALGSTTGTLTANDIVCSGEFERNALSSKSRSGSVIKYSTTRVGTGVNSTPVNVVALMTSSSGGNLWGNMLLPSFIQTSTFNTDIDLWINLNGV